MYLDSDAVKGLFETDWLAVLLIVCMKEAVEIFDIMIIILCSS